MSKIHYGLLSKDSDQEYDFFLRKFPDTLFYASTAYRNFLEKYLKAIPVYVAARDDEGNILATLPAFLKENKNFGNILNSLPFYGSNGGIVCGELDPQICHGVLNYFKDLAIKFDCSATTIISSPFDKLHKFYSENCEHDFIDKRIGQITPLPPGASIKIIENFIDWVPNHKTRNMIRKAIKSNIVVTRSNSKSDFDFLARTHQDSINALGGLAKESQFFTEVYQAMSNLNARLYMAYVNDKKIGGLLVFCFNNTVEYFTPAIDEKFRTTQALSLVICYAMRDAALDGYTHWNWGGTWLSQGGVYDFKRKWGTIDKPYHYYTKIYKEKILNINRQIALEEYPFFYVAPFDQLRG